MRHAASSSVGSNSRMLYAFSRDGAVPASKFWAKINPTIQVCNTPYQLSVLANSRHTGLCWQGRRQKGSLLGILHRLRGAAIAGGSQHSPCTPWQQHNFSPQPTAQAPVNAVWGMVLAAFVLGTPMLNNLQTFTAVTSIATIGLYISYALPILFKLLVARRAHWRPGPFHLGGASTFVGIVAIAWVAFIAVLFCLPPVSGGGGRRGSKCYVSSCRLSTISQGLAHFQDRLRAARGAQARLLCSTARSLWLMDASMQSQASSNRSPRRAAPPSPCRPQVYPITATTFNYAPVAVGIVLFICFVFWWLACIGSCQWFAGPPHVPDAHVDFGGGTQMTRQSEGRARRSARACTRACPVPRPVRWALRSVAAGGAVRGTRAVQHVHEGVSGCAWDCSGARESLDVYNSFAPTDTI